MNNNIDFWYSNVNDSDDNYFVIPEEIMDVYIDSLPEDQESDLFIYE